MPESRVAKEPPSTKRQIESELHQRLEVARVEYHGASEVYKKALERCDDLLTEHRSFENSNGKPHLTQQSASESVSSQRHAFERYRRALDDYNKFLLYGDLPVWP